jgi:hypothetical protein
MHYGNPAREGPDRRFSLSVQADLAWDVELDEIALAFKTPEGVERGDADHVLQLLWVGLRESKAGERAGVLFGDRFPWLRP